MIRKYTSVEIDPGKTLALMLVSEDDKRDLVPVVSLKLLPNALRPTPIGQDFYNDPTEEIANETAKRLGADHIVKHYFSGHANYYFYARRNFSQLMRKIERRPKATVAIERHRHLYLYKGKEHLSAAIPLDILDEFVLGDGEMDRDKAMSVAVGSGGKLLALRGYDGDQKWIGYRFRDLKATALAEAA